VSPGAQVSFLHGGDLAGRRVVFVHGTPGEAKGWADFLLNPRPGFEYVAVDRPGFGASGPDAAVPSIPAQAAALAPLLVERRGKWPILVGHSLGGPIVAQLALDNPGKVGAVVIAAGSLDPGLERIHWAQPIGDWPPVRSLLPRAYRNANQELMALKLDLERLSPRLPTLRCGIQIVHGTDDDLVPFENVAYMRAHLKRATLSVTELAGRNHFLPWTSRMEIEAAISRADAMDTPCR
jgi:pimeloyl-ACP methyl ester carboxylesterase